MVLYDMVNCHTCLKWDVGENGLSFFKLKKDSYPRAFKKIKEPPNIVVGEDDVLYINKFCEDDLVVHLFRVCDVDLFNQFMIS
jgi:hypothetical protein